MSGGSYSIRIDDESTTEIGLLINQEAEKDKSYDINSILGQFNENNKGIRINIKQMDLSITLERLSRASVDASLSI